MPMIDVYLVSGRFLLRSPLNRYISCCKIYTTFNDVLHSICIDVTESVCAADDRNQKWIAGKKRWSSSIKFQRHNKIEIRFTAFDSAERSKRCKGEKEWKKERKMEETYNKWKCDSVAVVFLQFNCKVVNCHRNEPALDIFVFDFEQKKRQRYAQLMICSENQMCG